MVLFVVDVPDQFGQGRAILFKRSEQHRNAALLPAELGDTAPQEDDDGHRQDEQDGQYNLQGGHRLISEQGFLDVFPLAVGDLNVLSVTEN